MSCSTPIFLEVRRVFGPGRGRRAGMPEQPRAGQVKSGFPLFSAHAISFVAPPLTFIPFFFLLVFHIYELSPLASKLLHLLCHDRGN